MERRSTPKGLLEQFIHARIHDKRLDIGGIVHSHSPSVIAFSLVPVLLDAMFHNAAFLGSEVPTFDMRDRFGPTDMLVSDALAEHVL